MYQWIKCFLTDRLQSVVVNGQLSDPVPVASGVPQGSVLGPLIFLILIADIDSDTNGSVIRSFADDTRVTNGVSSLRDMSVIQSDLDTIYDWSESNNMLFNDAKFELLRYGMNDSVRDNTYYYTNTGTIITEKEEVKDLGVIINNDVSFTSHIDAVIESAKQLTSWVLRTFKTRDHGPMLILWKSLILPKIEYCSQLWCPLNKADIQRLERLQKTFLSKINGNQHLNYWEQLRKYKLYSLERRRERYRVIYIWKVLEKLVPNIGKGVSIVRCIRADRHGRRCIIPPVITTSPAFVQNARESSLTVHGGKLFNALPKYLRDATECSVDNFKGMLDKYFNDILDEPQVPGYTGCRKADSNSLIDMIPLSTSKRLGMVLSRR